VTPAYLNNWGVTPGPGIVQELGTYEVPVNGTYTFWNSTYAQVYTRLQNDPVNSSQYFADARQCAEMNALEVPVVPLYNVFGFLAISTAISWGSITNHTGIYNTQAETGPEFWSETLFEATPVAGATSSGQVTVTATVNATVVTTITSGGSAVTVTSIIPTTVTTGAAAASSTSSSSSSSSVAVQFNFIIAAAVAMIVLVIGAIAAVMRRRPGSREKELPSW
jgi:acyl-CoA synthetase (AMP-forming)/AMP-acid ligase II